LFLIILHLITITIFNVTTIISSYKSDNIFAAQFILFCQFLYA